MLKTILTLVLVSFIGFSLVSVVKAQTPEPTEEPGFQLPEQLPETPQDAANDLLAALTVLVGMITAAITNFIKEKFPDSVTGPAVDLVAAVSAAVLSFIAALLVSGAGFVEATQIWPFLVWAWPIAKGIAEGQKLVRGVGFIGSTDTP